MTYKEFTVYVSRIRRKKKHLPQTDREDRHIPFQVIGEPTSAESPDPFQNLRQQRDKKRAGGFELDPFSDNKGLID